MADCGDRWHCDLTLGGGHTSADCAAARNLREPALTPMKATMLLADAAQESGGKLYVLGGGWSIVKRSGPMSMALAIKIEVPWADANARHEIVAELLNEDGAQAVSNGRPVRMEGALEVGRPADIPAGTALDAPLALTLRRIRGRHARRQ